MSFSKVIASGPLGQVVVAEASGEFKVQASMSASLGGGEASGFAKAVASMEIDVEAAELIDLGLEVAKAKFPAAAALIDAAKGAIDAEIAKA